MSKEASSAGMKRLRIQFSSIVKKLCWFRAEVVPGRDPRRWRKDAVGNVVGNFPTTPYGALAYSFDAIIPFSKGGRPVVDNCQLLQTVAHMWKVKNNPEADKTELANHSYDISFSDEALDGLEMAYYGDVVRIAGDGTAHRFHVDLITGHAVRIAEDGTELVHLPELQ